MTLSMNRLLTSTSIGRNLSVWFPCHSLVPNHLVPTSANSPGREGIEQELGVGSCLQLHGERETFKTAPFDRSRTPPSREFMPGCGWCPLPRRGPGNVPGNDPVLLGDPRVGVPVSPGDHGQPVGPAVVTPTLRMKRCVWGLGLGEARPLPPSSTRSRPFPARIRCGWQSTGAPPQVRPRLPTSWRLRFVAVDEM